MFSKPRERACQRGRGVQRFWPLQADAEFRRICRTRCPRHRESQRGRTENLSAAGADLHAFAGNGVKSLFNRRADPGAAARALALKSKPPLRNLGNAFRDKLGGMLGLLRVGIGTLRPAIARLPFDSPAGGCTVRVGTLCAVNSTGTGSPVSSRNRSAPARSRSAKASASSGWCAQPSVKSMRRVPASAWTARL